MFEISRIEELRTLAIELLAKEEEALAQKPESVFRRMLVETAKGQVEEWTAQLVAQKKKRGMELVELRLVGEKAHFGSLPMHLVGQLAGAFEEMLVQVGRFIKHGSQGESSVQTIRSLMDVRLNRLSSGSTRLFITAKTNPDLFGASVAEESLVRTFSLLAVEQPDELTEKAAHFGQAGVKSMSRFLKTLAESDLAASLDWQTPFDTTLRWEGSVDRISRLQQSLTNLIEDEPIEIAFAGEILTESIRGQGQFEIKDNFQGKIYSGRVAPEVLPSLLALRVGAYCRGIVRQITLRNQTTGQQKASYELVNIEPASAPTASQQLEFAF